MTSGTCCVCWWAGVSRMHLWHVWSVFCSFLIFLSFFEVTFLWQFIKVSFPAVWQRTVGWCWCQIQASIRHVSYFPLFFHTYNFHGVRVQSSFAYAGGGVSFSLFLLLFCSPFLSQLLHHYDFCTFSLVLFRTFFFSLSLSVPLSCYFLHVFCGGAASSGIFLFILFHFFLFPSFSFTGDLNDVCLYPCTFITEWSVFVFRVPCPSSGRSCSMSAGKLKAPQTEPAMVWHSGERCFHLMQGEEVEVPCQ